MKVGWTSVCSTSFSNSSSTISPAAHSGRTGTSSRSAYPRNVSTGVSGVTASPPPLWAPPRPAPPRGAPANSPGGGAGGPPPPPPRGARVGGGERPPLPGECDLRTVYRLAGGDADGGRGVEHQRPGQLGHG